MVVEVEIGFPARSEGAIVDATPGGEADAEETEGREEVIVEVEGALEKGRDEGEEKDEGRVDEAPVREAVGQPVSPALEVGK